ncbi:ABC transporter permease [Rickettsiales endosymbiont of Stachyamoeba lipophora]|uniref:ABC transporter permease n=1 Tax=Rickettsiales endosymbiont of Stachyamoeba lipophora TaxID=2486578 RepID=UPI000F655BFF|nr:ABC transporter permease [Rickettsiales endosymbiont of Stachyamoeba lipophora]AZL16030.1 ABC transporter permease [Rickettsiales endosymbiont of Stachyamoeba lipophora]
MNLMQILGATEIGLVYAIVALGIFLTFKVINFADLTVDGSFPLGAAITAVMITKGHSLFLSLILSAVGGAVCGFITSMLSQKLKIMDLLAGILMMTALYSINLRIMGQPNIALFNDQNIFNGKYNLMILAAIIITIFAGMTYLFKTEFGLALRAVGINSKCSLSQGINLVCYQTIALSLANGLASLAGGIFALTQGFADISMGAGTAIIGLASVIIGEKLTPKNFIILLWSCVLGSITYRLAVTMALNADFLGLESSDLNLITALIVIGFIAVPKLLKKTNLVGVRL